MRRLWDYLKDKLRRFLSFFKKDVDPLDSNAPDIEVPRDLYIYSVDDREIYRRILDKRCMECGYENINAHASTPSCGSCEEPLPIFQWCPEWNVPLHSNYLQMFLIDFQQAQDQYVEKLSKTLAQKLVRVSRALLDDNFSEDEWLTNDPAQPGVMRDDHTRRLVAWHYDPRDPSRTIDVYFSDVMRILNE